MRRPRGRILGDACFHRHRALPVPIGGLERTLREQPRVALDSAGLEKIVKVYVPGITGPNRTRCTARRRAAAWAAAAKKYRVFSHYWHLRDASRALPKHDQAHVLHLFGGDSPKPPPS